MLSSSPAIIHQAPPAPVQPIFLHNHVLRKKYRDPLKLKQALTKTFGEGNYKIKVRTVPSSVTDWSGFRFEPLLTCEPEQVRADRWIVTIPREMSNVRSKLRDYRME